MDMLLRLDRLMEPVGIAASRHDSAGELVYDQDLIVLYHIVLIPRHEIVCAKSEDNIMLNLQILDIGEVPDMEVILDLLHALKRKVYRLLLLIDDEVPALLDLLSEDRVDLRKFRGFLSPLQLSCEQVADLIELRGLPGLTRNDERCPRLIDQDRVDLVDDAVVQAAEHLLVFVDRHIISEVIEAELIVCDIGDVTAVGGLPLLRLHIV